MTDRSELERRLLSLLEDAECEVWANCGCGPKRVPGISDIGDQWELVRYDIRRRNRTNRCEWHKSYDAALALADAIREEQENRHD